MQIRAPRADELGRLQAIEAAAGAQFAAAGMPEIADDDPPPVGVLEAFRVAERVLVAEVGGTVAAYLLWLPLDGAVHVEQVSVDPAFAGRGIGAALIDALAAPVLTLTTFRDVPWNAPYYRRLGFEVLETPGPELAALVAEEAAAIPGDAPRVAMRRGA